MTQLGQTRFPLTRSQLGDIVSAPPVTEEREHPKLGLALSGGGHRAAFFHIGVLARLAELGLLRPVQVISTVSGGSIVGALYYLHVKNLLESKADAEIADGDYVELVRAVEQEYREAAASNVRGSGWANVLENFRMALPTYSRTDRVGALYEQRFYAKAWGGRPKRGGRIAMRDLLIEPKGHEGAFDPDVENPRRRAPVPILLLEATTLNTGHNWRFEAMYMGEPPEAGDDRPVRPRGRRQEHDPASGRSGPTCPRPAATSRSEARSPRRPASRAASRRCSCPACSTT